MAIKGITGCDFSTGEFVATGGTGTIEISTSVKKYGSGSLHCSATTTGTAYAQLAASLSGATTFLRFWYRYDTKPSANWERVAVLNGTTQARLVTLNSSGNLELRTSAGTLQATGSTALSSGTWYLVQVGRDNSDGSIRIWLNGVEDAAETGLSWTGTTSQVYVGKLANSNGESIDSYFDDIALDDATYIDDTSLIAALTVDGDGSTQNFTIGAGTGNHYEQVDETSPDGDTTYLLSSLVADQDELFTMSSAPADVDTIDAVCVMPICKADTNSSTLKAVIKSGGTTQRSSTATFSTAAYVSAVFNGSTLPRGYLTLTDPDTAATWTVSGVNAMEVGVAEGEVTDKSRVTAVYAYVLYIPAVDSGFPGMMMMGIGG